MEKRDYLTEFREKYYDQEKENFLNQTVTYLENNSELILNQIQKKLEWFFDVVIMVQEKIPIEVGEIKLSFLLSSIYCNKPVFRLDAFDEYGIFGKTLCSAEMDASWLFSQWDYFHQKLIEHRKDMVAERYIHEEQIRLLMFEVIENLNFMAVLFMKKLIFYSDRMYQFKKMIRAVTFSITAGQYYDWQQLLYQEAKEVDIFFNLERKPLIFQRFKEKVYKEKKFKDLDLSCAQFENCKFLNCRFEDCILNDAVFQNCAFSQIDTQSVTMYGTTFIECRIRNMDFSGIDFLFKEKKANNCYGPAAFIRCETTQQLPDVEVR